MTEMLQEIFFTCLIPLVGILCSYGIAFIRKKIKEIQEKTDIDLLNKYLNMLIDLVETCVIATNQTYVDSLKEQGKFGLEEHDIAFHKTFEAIKALMTEEMRKVLNEAYGDLELYISQLIQEQVNVINFTRSSVTKA